MIESVGFDVFLDITADQPDLPISDASVGFFQGGLPNSQTFDLTAHEHDAAFKRIQNGIVVARLPVLGNHPFIGVGRRRLFLLRFLSHAIDAFVGENRPSFALFGRVGLAIMLAPFHEGRDNGAGKRGLYSLLLTFPNQKLNQPTNS